MAGKEWRSGSSPREQAYGIDVRGVEEVQRALSELSGSPEAKRALQKASTAGAKVLKPYVKSAAPKATGRLSRSVSSRQAQKERPAAVVSARPKVAFYRHMVIRGTKAHGPKKAKLLIFRASNRPGNVYTQRVRGTSPRPFIEEGFDAGRDAAEAKIESTMAEHVAAVARANGGR